MLDIWIKLKIITEFIIPGIIGSVFLFILFIVFARIIIEGIKENKKIKLLEKNNFERYLYDVSSCGNGAFYAWKKGDKNIREKDFQNYTIKELKEWIAQ